MGEALRLPLDVCLCEGNDEPACRGCARRLADRSSDPWQAWMEPIAEGEECWARIDAERLL